MMVDISVKCFPFAFAYPTIPVLTSVLAWISIKTISQKFQGFWAKSFDDAAKHCWFHDDNINLIKNIVEGNLFSVFLMMLTKHVHINWNLQWRLKSSVSFILKHIFIFSMFLTGRLCTIQNPIRFHPHKIQST